MMKERIDTFFSNYPKLTFKKNTTIIGAGDSPSGVFYLKSGHVRQYAVSKDGTELTLHIYSSPSFFPLFWAITDLPNRYYFESIDQIEVYKAPKLDVLKWIEKDKDILVDINKRILNALDKLTLRIERMTFSNARVRIISSLLFLSRHFGIKKGNAIEITHMFTHRELGSITGLTRETISRQIELLKKEGLLDYTKNSIILTNPLAMRQELADDDVGEQTDYIYKL